MLLSRHLKIAGGVATYGLGTYAAYEYFRPVPPLPSCKDRCCTFNKLAPVYDKEIEQDESTSGIVEMRREMVAHARGDVLEVAGGTGRNISFYGQAVKSLLITDYSESMLQVAARKVAEARAADAAASGPLSNVTLAVTDASKMALPSASYDTVVDTFGICSFEEPEAALGEMRRCCKPGGQVLLLEHGQSNWTLLAKWQRHRLNRHVVRWGCYCALAGLKLRSRRSNASTPPLPTPCPARNPGNPGNMSASLHVAEAFSTTRLSLSLLLSTGNRDILGLVQRSGLRIKSVERKHMGTTLLIIAENPPLENS